MSASGLRRRRPAPVDQHPDSAAPSLTPYLSHGAYRVAGKPDATYAIAIHNRLDERAC